VTARIHGLKPDSYYLIRGKDLMRQRVLCSALVTRIDANDDSLTRAEMVICIETICAVIPEEPVEAF